MATTRRSGKSADPVEERGFVPVDGTELHYRSAGSGPCLVFVHAGVTDSRLWNHQLEAFAGDYRDIAYDLRGFGRSVLPPGPYAHHEDLHRLFDELGVDSAHVVGSSVGAAVAVDFALEHPTRVRSLALVGPALGGYQFTDDATRAGWEAAADAFEDGDLDRVADIESGIWLAGVGRSLDDVDPGVRDLVRTMLLRSYELDDERATERELDPPAIDRLDELAVPVLVVYGDHERADIVDIAELLAERLDDVTVEVLANTAHLPPLERPDGFTATLATFLGRVTDGAFE